MSVVQAEFSGVVGHPLKGALLVGPHLGRVGLEIVERNAPVSLKDMAPLEARKVHCEREGA
jgi:hypothetical protein